MGCWNHTCALTHLPINAGEDVYVFLLQQHPSPQDHCYPTTYWKPLGLFFEGQYDDYGAVEDCHGDFLPIIVEAVRKRLFEMELGENTCHDIAVKREDFGIEQLFEADHEDRLFVIASGFDKQHYSVEKLRLKHIVIRKGVLDMLLDRYKIERYEQIGVGYKTVEVDFNTALAQMYDHLTFLASAGDDPTARILARMDSENSGAGRVYISYLRDSYEVLTHEGLSRLAETDKEDLRKQFAYQITVWYWLSAFMNNSRNMWCPPSGCGSQDQSTDSQRLLAHITIDAAIQYDHQYNNDE